MSDEIDQFYRAVAELSVSFDKIVSNQDSLKSEVKTIVPRLDVLAAEVGQLADRLHTANGLMVKALDEAARVHEEYNVLDRAINHVEAELKAHTLGLTQAQTTLEKMVDVLETRVQRLRDSVIPPANPEGTAT